MRGKEKEVKMVVQDEGEKRVEPRSKEEFLSIERGLEELVAKMEEEVGVEDYYVRGRCDKLGKYRAGWAEYCHICRTA